MMNGRCGKFSIEKSIKRPKITNFIGNRLNLFKTIYLRTPSLRRSNTCKVRPSMLSTKKVFQSIVRAFNDNRTNFFASFHQSNVSIVITISFNTVNGLFTIKTPAIRMTKDREHCWAKDTTHSKGYVGAQFVILFHSITSNCLLSINQRSIIIITILNGSNICRFQFNEQNKKGTMGLSIIIM